MSQTWLPTLPHGVSPDQVRETVKAKGLVRVRSFPAHAQELIDFVGKLGTPLAYYGGDTGTHPDATAIWRVRYDHDASARGEVHALDGPLLVHSSQSLLEPRPRYFCMLMVNPGWQDQPSGFNGESLLVPWNDAVKRMSTEYGEDYEAMLAGLMSDVHYPSGVARSPMYRIGDMKNEFDFGIRLKSDLVAHLRSSAPDEYSTWVISRFADIAQNVARLTQLDGGDLVVVDNDRWGHGRASVVGRRADTTGWLVNPRELWSLTVA